MKIAVFTDSLGLPRDRPEVVNYSETWVNMLKQNHQIYQVSIGGGTIEDLYNQAVYVNSFNPDVVIIQSGIVDCTPRALTKTESYILNKYKLTQKILKYILKEKTTKFLRKYRRCSYTPLAKFLEYSKMFKATFSNSKVYFIGIVPASVEYEKKVPRVTKSINHYNKKLSEIFKDSFIETSCFASDKLMSDNIHLNTEGNKLLATIVERKLNEN